MNKETSKEPGNEIFVAVSSQKGGIGKSTITTLLSNYLHNVAGYNVGVLDCDHPQHSIYLERVRELELIEHDEELKAQACDVFRKTGKKAFVITDTNPVDALDQAEVMTEDEDLDIVFFDLPGTINSNGVLKTLSQMDYIFVPISADPFVIDSALQFVELFRDKLMTTGKARTKDIVLFWTMTDRRERTEIYDMYDKVIPEMGFRILNTRLPNSVRFRRELTDSQKAVFRSTLFPPDVALLKGSNIKELAEEFLATINQ